MVLTAKNLQIGYGSPIAQISLELYKGQKLGIIGENGIGKSTLLKTINGSIPKISGELNYGYNVSIGYFDQQIEFEDTERTVFDEMYEKFPDLTTTQIRTMLGSFLFFGDDVLKKINVLSGGEKGRLRLCEIFKTGSNLLLLDEPTNHMDIIGKETLEEILKQYPGTLIFVSHDRYFVNKIADSLLVFESNKVTYFNGKYDEYVRKKEESNNKEDSPLIIQEKNIKKENNPYFINKEINKMKNRVAKLEKEIENREEEIKLIQNEMMKEEISTDYIKLKELEEKIQSINKEIEGKMLEWEQLNMKLEQGYLD